MYGVQTTRDSHELAWAAGFYDGEGCTQLMHVRPHLKREKPYRNKDYPTIRIIVTQAERATLERFQQAVGDGNIIGPITKNRPGRRPLYRLSKNGPAAVEILRTIWPWLSGPKREQALAAVAIYNESLATRRAYGGKPRVATVTL
jgi:hypothetical protein